MGDHNSINVGEELSKKVVIYKNISPKIVVVDLVQLRNLIRDHDEAIKKSADWVSILALFVSLVLANITASFHHFLGLSPDTWKAIFVICTIASAIWLIVIFIQRYRNRNTRCVDYLIKQLTDEATASSGNGTDS